MNDIDMNDFDDHEMAYAKINLALHILGRRDDGYHNIDTIFAFADDGDQILVKKSHNISLDIIGPFAQSLGGDVSDNLVMKTAELIKNHYGIDHGAAITLEKKLPIASGIGGGSADAAATARVLNRFWGLQRPLDELAALVSDLGADIPACIYSKTCRGTGKGSDIIVLDEIALKNIPILLVNPMIKVETGPIFAAWDRAISRPLEDISMENILNPENHLLKNDLERAALSLCPEIQNVLNMLNQSKPMIKRMSGSGATCFALYHDMAQRDAAHQIIIEQYPHWWAMNGLLK